MSSKISPIVPTSMTRPKEAAKAFHRLFPENHKLSDFQQLTANMYGFADWHSLEAAVAAKVPGAPFDEDLEQPELNARLTNQNNLLMRAFGIEPTPVPLVPIKPYDEYSEESRSNWQPDEAFNVGSYYWHSIATQAALLEIKPTQRVRPVVTELYSIRIKGRLLCDAPNFVEGLAAYLRRWNPEMAELYLGSLNGLDFKPNVASSVHRQLFALRQVYSQHGLFFHATFGLAWHLSMRHAQLIAPQSHDYLIAAQRDDLPAGQKLIKQALFQGISSFGDYEFTNTLLADRALESMLMFSIQEFSLYIDLKPFGEDAHLYF